MEYKRILSVCGAALIFLGVFAPSAELPLMGRISFLASRNSAGIFLLLIAALTIGATLANKHQWLWLATLLGMLSLLLAVLQTAAPQAGALLPHGPILIGVGLILVGAVSGWCIWQERRDGA